MSRFVIINFVWCHDPNRQVAEGTEVYWKKKTEEKRRKGGAERET